MDLGSLLLQSLTLILTAGVGGVVLVGYAARDLFLKDEEPPAKPRFDSDYQELMWLALLLREHASTEQMRRFYQLRGSWPAMHSHIRGPIPTHR